MDIEKQIKEIDKKILMTNIIDLPGTIMFALGLYGKFAANGNAFVPWLNDGQVVNFLLVFGALIMAGGGYRIFTLIREKARLVREGGNFR
jgi:hypothetical protein